jgi:hypothetical protein
MCRGGILMSIKIMNQIWEHSKQKGSSLLLLLAIADHADDDGYCWPGIENLAQKIRMSDRQTTRILEQLEKRRELYIQHSRRHGNKYVILAGKSPDEIRAVLKKRNTAKVATDCSLTEVPSSVAPSA